MRALQLVRPGEHLSVLCLGSSSDDIEIGAGATILSWIASGARLDIHWCVLSAGDERAAEAKASATAFMAGAERERIEIAAFRDGFFPYEGHDLKSWMEGLKGRARPDVIFTHRRDDAHQDHHELCRLTWNTFRNHLILVRDPKVGRRPWPAQLLRAGQRPGRAAQGGAAPRPFRHAAFEGLVRYRNLPGGWLACAAWSAERLKCMLKHLSFAKLCSI